MSMTGTKERVILRIQADGGPVFTLRVLQGPSATSLETTNGRIYVLQVSSASTVGHLVDTTCGALRTLLGKALR
jgi:hypothetical protein